MAKLDEVRRDKLSSACYANVPCDQLERESRPAIHFVISDLAPPPQAVFSRPGDPPMPPLKRGENLLKVPL